MWDRIKALFGFAEEVVTLASKHADALADTERAASAFTYAASKFEDAAEVLREVAAEAVELAKEHTQRAEAATQQAIQNVTRAAKIRDLLG